MPKRIMWKKGMRLTEEVLSLSDKCTAEFVEKGFLLGTCGRMGLLPCSRPFSISVDINKEVVDVISIDCVGFTRNGSLIDVRYDTTFTNTFNTRTFLLSPSTEKKYYLCASVSESWIDTNNGLCEPLYAFGVIDENSPVPDNALPVARIVFDEYCWRVDEADFIPPCLYITSHSEYEQLAKKFLQVLKELDSNLPRKLYTESKDAVKIFWPVVQQLMIATDKELNTMSPMTLLSYIQKLSSAFYCACTLDEYIDINDPEQFISFINTPYNFRDSYATIRRGVNLSLTINERIKSFDAEVVEHSEEQALAAPSIEKGQLRQMIKFGNAQIRITNNAPGSTIFYTTDGSVPNHSSKSGNVVTVDSGFSDNWHKEPPKKVVIRVIAFKDGVYSNVETFEVVIKKGNPFTGKQI